MCSENELGVIRIDGSILHHLDQMPCQQRVHTGFYLVYYQNRAGFQSRKPHTDAREETLCPNGFLTQREPETLRSAIFGIENVQCGDDRLFLGACNADVLDTEVCIQHFMQDTSLFRAALPDGRQGGIQLHFGSHKAGQFLKEPQIGLLSLGTVPFVGAGQVKPVFCGASGKGKLFLNILAELITIAFSGKNQSLPAVGPVIEIFGQDFGLVKREPIGILDAAIKIDGFKAGRLCRLVSESKRLLRKGLAFQQLGISATDHFPHEQEGMENIALSGCICAVQCQHRHKLFLFVRRNQAIRQTFIRRCFQADNSRVLDGAVVGD